MSATITMPTTESSPMRLRTLLVVLAVVVLLALSFVMGRATSSSASEPAITTPATAVTPVHAEPQVPCNAGEPC